VPLLGDIPILGSLFRSVQYRRAETELLVVVTARLTKPVAPHELPRLPTDEELNDPNDFELFLLGSEGRNPPPAEGGDGPAGPAAPSSQHAGRGPSGELGFIR
jgi:pilus assembly protein CpaC